MDIAFATKFIGALFAIMNPFVNVPLFLSPTTGKTVAEQRGMALLIVVYTSVMYAVISLAGGAIIHFFGLTIDAFWAAGGLVLVGIAMSMLHGTPVPSHERTAHERATDGAGDSDNNAFYPMTFPRIVGPGTIATLIIYANQAHGATGCVAFAVVLAAVIAALLVVLFFADAVGKLLSTRMRVIMTRLMGMILAAIAVEMVFAGAKAKLPRLA